MVLTPEEIIKIEEFASQLFSPKEVAIIMGLEVDAFVLFMKMDNLASRAYFKGKLLSESKVRKSIIELASKGSSPAQALAMELIKDSNLKHIDV